MKRPLRTAVRSFSALLRSLNQPRVFLPLFSAAAALGVIPSLLNVLGTRSQTREAFLLGYSLERILLAAGLLLIAASLLLLTVSLVKRPQACDRIWESAVSRPAGGAILGAAILVFLLCWVALFLPPYRMPGSLSGYVVRLYPVFAWLAAVCFAAALTLLLARKKEPLGTILSANQTALRTAGATLAACFILWAVIALTGLGVRHREDYWYGPGVPLLGLQILFSMVLGMFALWIESRGAAKNPRRLDALIFTVIWLAAAWLWAREPLRPNYFLPDTAKNAIYPYSDSALFDMGSQFALIGQGLFNGQYFDRALYSAFLTYLHVLAGQDTATLMTAQAAAYAAFPAILYLLGRELHSRAFGVSAAALVSLRGVNAIAAATWLDLAGPKTMLTDFPTAIGVALFTLFAVKWLKAPFKISLAVYAGGMLGLTLMLRTHALLLMPVLVGCVLLPVVRLRWNLRAAGSLALILGMIAATTPWDIRNLSNGTPMFYVYYYRIQVILRERYGTDDTGFIPSPAAPAGPPGVHARVASAGANPLEITDCNTRGCSLFNHLFRNLIASALFLPSTPVFDGLWNTIKEGAPYWRLDWSGGGLGRTANLLIALNLALISLGLGTAWERRRFIGALPAVIFTAYLVTNALAFTSGGRYIVPVDWIVCLYFMLGLFQIGSWLVRLAGVGLGGEAFDSDGDHVGHPIRYSRGIAALAVVFALGALVPLSEVPFPRRYQTLPPEGLLAMLEGGGWLERAGLQRASLADFLSDPHARIVHGRALYPRYYRAGEGEPKRLFPYQPLGYSRLAFTAIGNFGVENVVIPGGRPRFDFHAADVVVIGCANDQYLDALVVIPLSEPAAAYHRFPQSALECPLPPP